MEFFEEQTTKRWVRPDIKVPSKAYPTYRSQARLYNVIYDQIIELGQNHGTWFRINYTNAVSNKRREWYYDVFYGFDIVRIYDQDESLVQTLDVRDSPQAAHDTAVWVVDHVFPS